MRRLFICLLLPTVFACADEEGTSVPATFSEACIGIPGCDAPSIALDAPPMSIWRVLVARDAAGAVRVEEVHEISVSSAIGAPQGPLHGPWGLASLDAAGQALEVQFVNFPTTRFFEDFDGDTSEEDLTGLPVSMVGYLPVRDEAMTLAIVDGEGNVEHSIPAPSPGEAVQFVEAEGGSQALIQGVPAGPCAHVMILDGIEDAAWNAAANSPAANTPAYAHRAPTATQLALVRAALGRMTAVHCMGLGRIAFVDRPGAPGSVVSWEGDFVNINANYQNTTDGTRWAAFDEVSLQDPRAQALFQGVILHEAAHTTTYLLSALSDLQPPGFSGSWEPTERRLAAETIDRVRLRGDLVRLWDTMHDSFMARGWGDPYYATSEDYTANRESASAADIVGGGFTSPYGRLNIYEDIAEWATWPIAGDLYEGAGIPSGFGALKRGYGCGEMSAYATMDVPSGLAAAFTKLTFMRDLGFVTEENYQRCIGPALGLPNNAQGIAIYQSEELRRVFGTNVVARIEEREERFVFVLEADGMAEFGGMEYPGTLTLEIGLGVSSTGIIFTEDIPIEQISWPRGTFALGVGQPHSFRLRLEGAAAGNFDVTEGFVLAAASTNDRLSGSVVVNQVFRNQAPVPVPQTFDPPLQFRYLIEN